jgi:hypothetical protein
MITEYLQTSEGDFDSALAYNRGAYEFKYH